MRAPAGSAKGPDSRKSFSSGLASSSSNPAGAERSPSFKPIPARPFRSAWRTSLRFRGCEKYFAAAARIVLKFLAIHRHDLRTPRIGRPDEQAMRSRFQRAQAHVVRIAHAVVGHGHPVVAVVGAVQVKPGLILENIVRTHVAQQSPKYALEGVALDVGQQGAPFEGAQVEPSIVLAHAPEVAVEHLVETGAAAGQRFFVAVRRVARCTDDEV